MEGMPLSCTSFQTDFFSNLLNSSVQDLSEVLKKVEVLCTGSHSQARTKL